MNELPYEELPVTFSYRDTQLRYNFPMHLVLYIKLGTKVFTDPKWGLVYNKIFMYYKIYVMAISDCGEQFADVYFV